MHSPLDLYCACQPGRRCQRGVQYLNLHMIQHHYVSFSRPPHPPRYGVGEPLKGFPFRASGAQYFCIGLVVFFWRVVASARPGWFSFVVVAGVCCLVLWGPSGLRPALGCLRSFWRLFVFWRSGGCAHRGVFLFFFLAIRLACVLLPLRAASAHGWFTCQIDCRTRCQIECQIECQNIRQIRFEKECQNDEYVISR